MSNQSATQARTSTCHSATEVERAGLDRLYRHNHRWLRAWLKRRLNCSETAADLAHDTFVRLLSHPQNIAKISEPRSYLRIIAERLCVDLWRRKSVERSWLEVLVQQPEGVSISPEAHALVIETLIEVDRMLQSLPQRVAQAFMLAQLEGLTYKLIGQRLGVSERSVKTYMAQAMLQSMLIEARFDDSADEHHGL